jgi:peptidoglycan hydrolase-like protein with peptidoglycan-binding domain
VPATPTPAFPGLPTPPPGGIAPGQGLPGDVAAQLRPSTQLNAAQVAQLQSQLAANGFYRGPIDGILGSTTLSSVRAFQQSASLPATGTVDAQTAAMLGLPLSSPTGSMATGAPTTTTPSTTTTTPSTTTTTTPTTTTTTTITTTVTPLSPLGPVPTAPTATGTTDGRTASPPFPLSNPPQMNPNEGPPVFIQP